MSDQINVRVHNGLMSELDEYVGDNKPYSTRQDFIREAIRDKLRTLKAGA